ncbi:MAG: hypothetical protein HY851_10610 [candidate division Zixibacteria bacterium]|nr:hypothetical protein [candidate division Zixibacteria bacterium]
MTTYLLFLAVALVCFLFSVKLIRRNQMALVYRFGKPVMALKPGLQLTLPFIDAVKRLSVDEARGLIGRRVQLIRSIEPPHYGLISHQGEYWPAVSDVGIENGKWVTVNNIDDNMFLVSPIPVSVKG